MSQVLLLLDKLLDVKKIHAEVLNCLNEKLDFSASNADVSFDILTYCSFYNWYFPNMPNMRLKLALTDLHSSMFWDIAHQMVSTMLQYRKGLSYYD